MLTYQDYVKETEGKSTEAIVAFINKAIREHSSDPLVKMAVLADKLIVMNNGNL